MNMFKVGVALSLCIITAFSLQGMEGDPVGSRDDTEQGKMLQKAQDELRESTQQVEARRSTEGDGDGPESDYEFAYW